MACVLGRAPGKSSCVPGFFAEPLGSRFAPNPPNECEVATERA